MGQLFQGSNEEGCSEEGCRLQVPYSYVVSYCTRCLVVDAAEESCTTLPQTFSSSHGANVEEHEKKVQNFEDLTNDVVHRVQRLQAIQGEKIKRYSFFCLALFHG